MTSTGITDYVNQLSEFLLDANGFSIGASQMKRKLFIIVSKSASVRSVTIASKMGNKTRVNSYTRH